MLLILIQRKTMVMRAMMRIMRKEMVTPTKAAVSMQTAWPEASNTLSLLLLLLWIIHYSSLIDFDLRSCRVLVRVQMQILSILTNPAKFG